MKNLRKMIVLLALGMTLFAGCSKKPAEEAGQEVDKQVEEDTGTEESDDLSLESIKLDLQETDYKLVELENGKKYIELDDFSNYLAPSKHRFSIKANDKNKRVAMKAGEFNFKRQKKDFDLKDVSFDEYEVRLDGKSKKYQIGFLDGVYWLEVKDAMELFGFKLDGDKMVFDDPDTKMMENANNRDYNWYEDQAHTGEYSDGNCGPTSMSMVLKWIDPNSTATGESCRNDVPNDGDWWNTMIVEDYFKNNKVHYDDVFYRYPELITDEIDKGNIVYVCAIMKEVSQNRNPDKDKFGRFYDFDGGHFFLIKGYKVIDSKLYFEVYDPNNWDMVYSESGEPMGKDRLYLASEVDQAIKNWYMTVYSIYPGGK